MVIHSYLITCTLMLRALHVDSYALKFENHYADDEESSPLKKTSASFAKQLMMTHPLDWRTLLRSLFTPWLLVKVAHAPLIALMVSMSPHAYRPSWNLMKPHGDKPSCSSTLMACQPTLSKARVAHSSTWISGPSSNESGTPILWSCVLDVPVHWSRFLKSCDARSKKQARNK